MHPDLVKCLQEKEEIVYFWTGNKLEASDSFYFAGGGYYWTMFPKKHLTEKQNAQEYLDKKYPKEKRNEVKELSLVGIKDVGWELLTGKLDLSDFVNLKYLDCSDNQLTDLNLSNCSQLEKLYLSNNSLTNVNSLLSNINPKKLKELDLSHNRFSKTDLNKFSKFINLETLDISNNHFAGSLMPLKDLSKLKELNIANTNIKSGLEYLPNGLEIFQCYDPDYERDSFKSTELYKAELNNFNGNLKIWKEFYNSPVREWLDGEYPKDEDSDLEEDNYFLGDLLNEEKDTPKKRKAISKLDISNKNLEGPLKLKGFINLKILNCVNNKLTKLDLSNCPNLIELNVSNNELCNLEFLKHVAKLEILSVVNNQKLSPQDLSILLSLKNLKELNVNECPFEGSLKPLQYLNKLERLNISDTNISEGLKYLPKSCKVLYCNSEYQYKSAKIMEELDKSNCWDEKGNHKYYVPAKWREDKRNNMIASVIPLERLYVIRGNIKSFVSKWGIKKNFDGEDSANTYWYDRFATLLKKQEENKSSELSRLQHPNELWKHRWTIYGTQFLGRGSAIVGAVLTFQDQGAFGGGILAIYPFTELAVSKLEESLKNKEDKWKEFLADADTFLDNYHELMGILAPIEVKNLKREGVSRELTELNEKVEEFLNMYDDDSNKEIDIEELVRKRKNLSDDLNEGKENKIQAIIDAVRKLEEAIVKYRKSSYNWINEKESEAVSNHAEENQTETTININNSNQTTETDNQTETIFNNSSHSLLLDKKFNKSKKTLFSIASLRKKDSKNQVITHELDELSNQEQLENQIEIPVYGVPGSSK